MNKIALAMAVSLLSATPVSAIQPADVDWSQVPANELVLFYPGQSTYQWLRSKDHKRADMQVQEGQACVACHLNEEESLGDTLVKEGRLEPTPVEGKNGSIKLNFQVAYDNENAYFRFQWKTLNDYPGYAHPYWRYDGKAWKVFGGPKLDEDVQDGDQPGIYEDRMSIIIDDGAVPMFKEQGCWLTCHTGERDNPEVADTDDVKANPLFQHLKKKDVRKYIPASRTDEDASWDMGKTPEEIAKLKADGVFLDLMQWRAHRSNPVGMADDFNVMEYRNSDAGKNPFSKNWNKEAKQPKYMYDPAKFGSKSVKFEQIREKPTALIREQNAMPFDPNAGWQEGDLIPEYVVSREDSKGSAADNSQVSGVWKDGVWTVVWARKLNLTNPDDKALTIGKNYNFSFATHDDNITTRGHFVSFPVSVGFGADATIKATKLN